MTHQELRAQFPILQQHHDDQPLCYLDTAATSQKPTAVINAINTYYLNSNANVHRAAHRLSGQATQQYEHVRQKVHQFINSQSATEIIFSHGTTESINMIAYGLTHKLNSSDVILVDAAAHHANLVPWQQLAIRTGAQLKVIPLTPTLRIDEQAFDELLKLNPAIVALGHVSNALGTVNPLSRLLPKAKATGAITVVDGAQAIAHLNVDVRQLGCDFYVFSGHKMYGPTGIGILYGRYDILEQLQPMLTGGEMIKTVSFDSASFGELPNRLEAGTPPIAGVIGLGAAIDFIHSWKHFDVSTHEAQMLTYLREQLLNLGDIQLYAPHHDNVAAIAFNLATEHHQDVGILLDQQHIAIRCGHHCAMPLMALMNIDGCCRASIGIYTNTADIDQFIEALRSVKSLLL